MFASFVHNGPLAAARAAGDFAGDLQAFAGGRRVGTLIAFMFVQSRAIEVSLFPYAVLLQVTPVVAIAPLIIILVKNTKVAGASAPPGGAVSDHLQHHAGLAQRRSGLAQLFPDEPGGALKTLIELRFPARCLIFSAACASPAAWR